MTHLWKRASAFVVAALAVSLTLAGCGTSGSPAPGSSGTRPAEETGPVTIKFSWWGNDVRNRLTQQAIDLFRVKYPNITVEVETADFASYWQKLATEIAAGNTPDVMQMDATYVQQYVADGNIMDLDSLAIDLSRYSQSAAEAGRVDGGLYAATFCLNVPVVLANPALFARAGVAIPDDATWTWDDFSRITAQIGAKGGSEYYGATSRNDWDPMLALWVRQHGKQQYNNDGSLGFTAEDLAPMFQYWLDVQKAGGTPPATVMVQDDQAANDQTLFATGRTALTALWSNMVVALDASTGQDLLLLRPPTVTGKAADGNLWLKSSQFLTIGKNTKHADAALKLVEFLLNDVEAGKILGTERGIPANLDVQAAIKSSLSPSDQKVVAFMDKVNAELGGPNGLPAPGGSQGQTLQYRYGQAVLLGTSTPQEAATAFVNELRKEMATG